MEAGAFPSDMYAMETQALFHGFDPADAIVEIAPRKGEHCIDHSDIEAAIQKHKLQPLLLSQKSSKPSCVRHSTLPRR